MLNNFRNKKNKNRKSKKRKSRNRKSKKRKSRKRKSKNRKKVGGLLSIHTKLNNIDNDDYDKNKLYEIIKAFESASYKWGSLYFGNYYETNFESLFELIFGKYNNPQMHKFLQLYHDNKEDLEKNFRIKGTKDINDVINIFLPLKDIIKDYCPFKYEFENLDDINFYLRDYYLEHTKKNIYIKTNTEEKNFIFTDHFIFCLCIFKFYVVYSKLPIYFLAIKNKGGSIYDEKVKNYFNSMCSKYKSNCRGIPAQAKEKNYYYKYNKSYNLKDFIIKLWDDARTEMNKVSGIKIFKTYMEEIIVKKEDIYTNKNKLIVGAILLIMYTDNYFNIFNPPWHDLIINQKKEFSYINLAKCCAEFMDYFIENYNQGDIERLLKLNENKSILNFHSNNLQSNHATFYTRKRLNRLIFCKNVFPYVINEININLNIGTVLKNLSRLSCFRGMNLSNIPLDDDFKKNLIGSFKLLEFDDIKMKWYTCSQKAPIYFNTEIYNEINVFFGYNYIENKFTFKKNSDNSIVEGNRYQLKVIEPTNIYEIDYLKNIFFYLDKNLLNAKQDVLKDYDGTPYYGNDKLFFDKYLVNAYKHIQIDSKVQKKQNKIVFQGPTSWSLDEDKALKFAFPGVGSGILIFCKQRDESNSHHSFYIAPWSKYQSEYELVFGSNSIFKLTDIVLLYMIMKEKNKYIYKKNLIIYCYEICNESWKPNGEYDFIAPGIRL